MKENIINYEKNKELYHLTKKRSSHSIKLVEDIDDKWFVYVLEYKTKSGEILHNSMIIAKDIDTWLSHLQHSGYEIKV